MAEKFTKPMLHVAHKAYFGNDLKYLRNCIEIETVDLKVLQDRYNTRRVALTTATYDSAAILVAEHSSKDQVYALTPELLIRKLY
jgi:hypothetical protein